MRARPLLLSLLTAAGGAMCASSARAQDSSRIKPATLDLPGNRVEVPMLMLPGSRATVRATINGLGPFTLAIETGAPMILLTEATALAAQLGDFTGGRMASLAADSIRIGAAVFRNHAVFTGPQFLPELDGLLGLPAYRDVLMTVDYPGQRVVFERGALPEADGRRVLNTVAMGPFVGVMMDFGTHDSIPAVIDTQGGTDISVAPETAELLRFVVPPVRVGEARVGGRAAVPELAGRLDGDLHIGGYTIQRPIIHVLSPPPGYPRQALIGAELLREFSVTLDQRNHRVRFDRTQPVIAPSPPARTIGLSLVAASDSVVMIGFVADSGAAAHAGLRHDDIVLAIAGRPAHDFLTGELRRLVSRGVPIRFSVQRAGTRLTFDVTPAVAVP